MVRVGRGVASERGDRPIGVIIVEEGMVCMVNGLMTLTDLPISHCLDECVLFEGASYLFSVRYDLFN